MRHPTLSRLLSPLPFSLFLGLTFGLLFANAGRAATSDLLLTTTGEVGGDWFGNAVAADIDFNADGYTDLVVGANLNDAGGVFAGRVYIYYRGPGSDNVADLTITGAVDDNLGTSLASAGDVNNDGFDDLIVGAIDCCLSKGLAYIYLGGPAPNVVPDLTLAGVANDDIFGWSVSGAGDVNGDGFDDVVIGAPQQDAAGTNAGRAYVYFGSAAPLNGTADITLTGEAALDQFGFSVAGAGDINSDGFDDVLVGAPFNDEGGNLGGRGYIYYGGSSPNSVADLVLTGNETNALGRAVSAAGDMNGDGFADIVLGAWSSTATATSRANVYYGGSTPNNVPDLVLVAASTGDSLGYDVASVGDVDGDGYDDILVGAPGSNLGGNSSGAAFLYRGGIAPDATPDLTFTGGSSIDLFGYSVAGAGDSDGDGRSEIFIGARNDNLSGSVTGRAYLYAVTGYRITSPDGGEQWVSGTPATVRWIGRELTDIAVSTDGGALWVTVAEDVGGAPENSYTFLAPTPASDQALVRIRMVGELISPSTIDVSDAVFRIVAPHDPPNAAHVLDLTVLGAVNNDQFGASLSAAGDVNGDGYADAIVGAQANSAGGGSAGRAYVYFGGESVDGTADWILTGAVSTDNLGNAVGDAGDVNGDGFDDVIVGSYLSDLAATNGGRVDVFFGGPSPNSTTDWTLTATGSSENFGISVDGAGDVNGDGYADIVVGSSFADAFGLNAGAALVYFGGPAPDATADWSLGGVAISDNMGASVAGAGDVNGDGFADIIAGATGNDAGGSASGRAYVYFGGVAPDAVADLTLTGLQAADQFGSTVAGGHDLNGDGYDDVAVGARLNDAGGSSAGHVQVFFGGPTPDSEPDLTVTGTGLGEQLGTSIALLPDVNGDGFADLLIGAPANASAGASSGRAYLLYGGPGMDARVDEVFSGILADQFGYAVGGPGDMNGDGFGDLAVGSRQLVVPFGPGKVQFYLSSRYHLNTPVAGATWNVGSLETVSWRGAEPADLWLSVDGGTDYSLLRADVGGQLENSLALRVPHQPTRFARLQLRPNDPATSGTGTSDSLFTIEASIALLSLKAEVLPEGGVELNWSTDPGPAELSGYRLERSPGNDAWTTVISLIRETSWIDATGQPGHRYRLHGVNGLGEEFLLGEAGPAPLTALSAWPLPYRSGLLNVTFLTASGPGGRAVRTELALFDPAGRRIRTLVDESFEAGARTTAWDGRDDAGSPVASGVYFLRVVTGGADTRIKVMVVR